MFAEGIRLVLEAIDAGAEIETLVVAPDLLTSDAARQAVATAASSGTPVLELSVAAFESLSRKGGPQGLGAVIRQRWQNLSEMRLAPDAWWLALDRPQDPGNVGAIVRTADAAGVHGVVLIGPSVDPYDPTALRASMGAAFTVPLARAPWTEVVTWARGSGMSLIGAAGHAAAEYRDHTYPSRMVLVMGSEREGLTPDQQAGCDTLVRIPMAGRADSLNLAVATGIVIYEIAHQRRGRDSHAGASSELGDAPPEGSTAPRPSA